MNKFVAIWQTDTLSLRTILYNTQIMCAIFLLTHTHNQLKINSVFHFGVWQGFKNLVMKKAPQGPFIYSRAQGLTPSTIHPTLRLSRQNGV